MASSSRYSPNSSSTHTPESNISRAPASIPSDFSRASLRPTIPTSGYSSNLQCSSSFLSSNIPRTAPMDSSPVPAWGPSISTILLLNKILRPNSSSRLDRYSLMGTLPPWPFTSTIFSRFRQVLAACRVGFNLFSTRSGGATCLPCFT
ncbi:MAG: hypothetical protein A4E26_01209 [Methanobacterium sp. PtaU1.Bin097]|nr:MAG: hypothetical protein A4E26_01209 [Methanobacterium sp. PtaU1.Bin097]